MSEKDIIQAIELAISHEMEARRSYLELSEQADDPELQRLLREIAQEEMGHEASLRSPCGSISRNTCCGIPSPAMSAPMSWRRS